MLKITIENVDITEDDHKIISAFKQSFKLYPKETLEEAWNDIKKCEFEHYITGRGANHIFVSRKLNKERIAIITE